LNNVTRRGFILRLGGAAGMLGLADAGNLLAQTKETEKQDVEVSPAEDLMREHGALRRILLIYHEWIKRLATKRYTQIETLTESSRIVRSFVEDYHEKLEEEYLFPRFKKAGKLLDLVNVLLQQHQAGRRLTDATLQLSNTRSLNNATDKQTLTSSLSAFIRMYEPHAAREDTVLFPAFHELLPAVEYDNLGDAFEDKEHELFGDNGFEDMVDRVASIEKSLGIYDLSQFTPKIGG